MTGCFQPRYSMRRSARMTTCGRARVCRERRPSVATARCPDLLGIGSPVTWAATHSGQALNRRCPNGRLRCGQESWDLVLAKVANFAALNIQVQGGDTPRADRLCEPPHRLELGQLQDACAAQPANPASRQAGRVFVWADGGLSRTGNGRGRRRTAEDNALRGRAVCSPPSNT